MEPAKMPNEQASKLLPPGSRNFRAASSTESDVDTKKTEQGAAPQNIANAQGAQQAPEQHDVSATGRGDYGAVSQGTQGSLGQISKEEIMIMRELLTRDNVDDSVKSSLLKQVIDQKIEGALKAERESSAKEREELLAQHQGDVAKLRHRLKHFAETCDAERSKMSAALVQVEEERFRTAESRTKSAAALAQAEEERRGRVMLEAEVRRAENSVQVARSEAQAAKSKCEDLEVKLTATRSELQKSKESLTAATVTQRLLQAYKSEKERCQADLEATLRRFSAPAWQTDQQLEELELSLKATDASLEELEAVLMRTRKRRMPGAHAHGKSQRTTKGSSMKHAEQFDESSGEPQTGAELERRGDNVHIAAAAPAQGPGHGAQGKSDLVESPGDRHAGNSLKFQRWNQGGIARQHAGSGSSRRQGAGQSNSNVRVLPLPLPAIPKKSKAQAQTQEARNVANTTGTWTSSVGVDNVQVIEIDDMSP